MNEKQANDKLAAIFKELKSGHYQRIETTTTSGVPDINICYMGMEAWIETKAGSRMPMIRKEQYAWGMRRAHAGGIVAVVLVSDDMYFVWRYPFDIVPVGNDERYVKPSENCHLCGYELSSIVKFLFPGV